VGVVGWTAETGDSRVRILAYVRCQSANPMRSGARRGAYLQAKLADGFAVLARLLGRGRRGQFDVVDAEFIEGCTGVAC
jgi:hypothetical protein